MLYPVPVILAIMLGILLVRSCGNGSQALIVYTSQDQVYAEPILKDFEAETGIKVRAVFDSEAVKTVGLANRLLAEKGNPQCDVFWNNEVFRAHQLEAEGVFREQDPFVEVGYRSRRVVINTSNLALAEAPRSLLELTNAAWRGKVALAYPLFGTTCTHFLALRQHWGAEAWENWCLALQANRPLLADGNSVVVRLVGGGEATIGLTDSDDIAAGQREGYPIIALPMTDETLLIPNTVAVVRGSPHPAAAQKLLEYLQQPKVLEKLVSVNALEGAAPHQVSAPTLRPDWDALLRDLEPATAELKEIFLR
jgi:iron(III) transport system substrate-binding protein